MFIKKSWMICCSCCCCFCSSSCCFLLALAAHICHSFQKDWHFSSEKLYRLKQYWIAHASFLHIICSIGIIALLLCVLFWSSHWFSFLLSLLEMGLDWWSCVHCRSSVIFDVMAFLFFRFLGAAILLGTRSTLLNFELAVDLLMVVNAKRNLTTSRPQSTIWEGRGCCWLLVSFCVDHLIIIH